MTGGDDESKKVAVRGGSTSRFIRVSRRQIVFDAKDWLKLLPLLRTATNMTANKGIMEILSHSSSCSTVAQN